MALSVTSSLRRAAKPAPVWPVCPCRAGAGGRRAAAAKLTQAFPDQGLAACRTATAPYRANPIPRYKGHPVKFFAQILNGVHEAKIRFDRKDDPGFFASLRMT
jgi:hypothetical protein